jgi:hypothetical protein
VTHTSQAMSFRSPRLMTVSTIIVSGAFVGINQVLASTWQQLIKCFKEEVNNQKSS